MMCPTREALPVEKCRLHAVRIASKGIPLRPPRAHNSGQCGYFHVSTLSWKRYASRQVEAKRPAEGRPPSHPITQSVMCHICGRPQGRGRTMLSVHEVGFQNRLEQTWSRPSDCFHPGTYSGGLCRVLNIGNETTLNGTRPLNVSPQWWDQVGRTAMRCSASPASYPLLSARRSFARICGVAWHCESGKCSVTS